MDKPRLKVKEIAEQQGLTASKLSKLTGLSRAVVYPIWNNETAPRIDTLQKIAAVLGCQVRDLIEDESDTPGRQKAGGTPQPAKQTGTTGGHKAAPIVAAKGELT